MKTFCIVSVTSLFCAGMLLALPAWAERQSINESRDVRANEKIYIENMRGKVNIVAGSGNQFRVVGSLDEKAEGFELTSKDGFTRFEVKMPRSINSNWRDSNEKEGSDLKIEVPLGSEVEFTGVNANVWVKGVQGGSHIRTVNGSIEAKDLKNDIKLETVNGEIDSENNHGRLTFDSVNGEIEDKNSSGRIQASAVNGEISLQSRATEIEVSVVNGKAKMELTGVERLDFSSVNGSIKAELKQSPQPRVSASSVNGKLDLKVEKTVSARIKMVGSAGGDLQNDLTSQKAIKAKYGPRRSLEFMIGEGDGSIDMSTVNGELKISGL